MTRSRKGDRSGAGSVEAATRDDAPAQLLPLVAETVRVDREAVVTGRVEVRTVTDTVAEHVRAAVDTYAVEVTRVAVDREVDAAPAVRTEGDTTVVPVLEEVLVVTKRLVLREEVRIRRVTRSDEVETTVPLRRQRAVVERHDAGPTSDTRGPTSPKERKP